ncbi:MAG: hypothetical protein WDO14_18920 [Bacteroidota bacterium]
MKTAPVIVLVIAIAACSPGEKATSTTDTTTTTNSPTPLVTVEPSVQELQEATIENEREVIPDDSGDTTLYIQSLAKADTLYNILARKNLGAPARPDNVEVQVLSENIMDIMDPKRKTGFLAALIETEVKPTITVENGEQVAKDSKGDKVGNDKWGNAISEYVVTLAIFDPSNNMKLVAYSYVEESMWSISEDVRLDQTRSSVDPGLNANVIQLIPDGGDVISISSTREHNDAGSGSSWNPLETTIESRDTWWSLAGDQVEIISSFITASSRETFGSGENERESSEATWETKNSKGILPNIIVTTTTRRKRVDQEDEVTDNVETLSFNGNEYVTAGN